MADAERTIRDKWRLLKATMNERARRLWAGAEAGAIGYGGVAAVARATGMAISTVRKGRDEARAGATPGYRAIGYARGEAPLGYDAEPGDEPVIEYDEDVLAALEQEGDFA